MALVRRFTHQTVELGIRALWLPAAHARGHCWHQALSSLGCLRGIASLAETKPFGHPEEGRAGPQDAPAPIFPAMQQLSMQRPSWQGAARRPALSTAFPWPHHHMRKHSAANGAAPSVAQTQPTSLQQASTAQPAGAADTATAVTPAHAPAATPAGAAAAPAATAAVARKGGKPAPRASSKRPNRPPAAIAQRVTAPEQHAKAPTTATIARAHCVGLELNLASIQDVFDRAIIYKARDFCVLDTQRMLHPPEGGPPSPAASHSPRVASAAEEDDDDASKDMPQCECMAVFEFGSVVFFSKFVPQAQGSSTDQRAAEPGQDREQQGTGGAEIMGHLGAEEAGPTSSMDKAEADGPGLSEQEEQLQHKCLKLLQQFAKNPVSSPPRFEEVRLVVCPRLKRGLKRGVNVLQFGQWDRGSVETVSRMMGRSVMLDHYTNLVDALVEDMEQLMDQMAAQHEKPVVQRFLSRVWGVLSQRTRSKSDPHNHEAQLLRSVLLTMQVINRLGVMDKDHTSWASDAYEELSQGLRGYYSMGKRNDNLFAKLEQVKAARAALLQLATDARSLNMEWLISILIMVEIAISLLKH